MMTSYLSIFKKKNINCQKNASCASKYVFTGRNQAIFTLGEFFFQKNNLRTTALVSQYANVKGGGQAPHFHSVAMHCFRGPKHRIYCFSARRHHFSNTLKRFSRTFIFLDENYNVLKMCGAWPPPWHCRPLSEHIMILPKPLLYMYEIKRED